MIQTEQKLTTELHPLTESEIAGHRYILALNEVPANAISYVGYFDLVNKRDPSCPLERKFVCLWSPYLVGRDHRECVLRIEGDEISVFHRNDLGNRLFGIKPEEFRRVRGRYPDYNCIEEGKVVIPKALGDGRDWDEMYTIIVPPEYNGKRIYRVQFSLDYHEYDTAVVSSDMNDRDKRLIPRRVIFTG